MAQSVSETILKITRSVETIAMAWFFILNQQASNNEDVVTSSKLTAAIVGSSCLFIWFQRQMDSFKIVIKRPDAHQSDSIVRQTIN